LLRHPSLCSVALFERADSTRGAVESRRTVSSVTASAAKRGGGSDDNVSAPHTARWRGYPTVNARLPASPKRAGRRRTR
jgi:hypothetical protein